MKKIDYSRIRNLTKGMEKLEKTIIRLNSIKDEYEASCRDKEEDTDEYLYVDSICIRLEDTSMYIQWNENPEVCELLLNKALFLYDLSKKALMTYLEETLFDESENSIDIEF